MNCMLLYITCDTTAIWIVYKVEIDNTISRRDIYFPLAAEVITQNEVAKPG
ncbi:MAG: hypothetical protein IPK10_14690 [Bacteroidetes bacterium]|nr:hypothetical protein [Bacteroidota bacterium]